MTDKTVHDLTNKEIIEDINYYLTELQMIAPSFYDGRFRIINMYTEELYGRFKDDE